MSGPSTPDRFTATVPHHVYTGRVWGWFELSYAQFLTIPRRVLCSMPEGWQERFVRCLEELDGAIDWRPERGQWWVLLRDDRGRHAETVGAEYRHAPPQPYDPSAVPDVTPEAVIVAAARAFVAAWTGDGAACLLPEHVEAHAFALVAATELLTEPARDSPGCGSRSGPLYDHATLEQVFADMDARRREALRNLTVHARTSGGTAGPDAELMAACSEAEDVLVAWPDHG